MQENIRHAVIGNDEAEALGDVEPLDPTGDLNEIDRLILGASLRVAAIHGRNHEPVAERFGSEIVTHDTQGP